MISATRKRVLLLTIIVVALFLLIRYLLYNGVLFVGSDSYHRDPKAPVVVAVYYEALCPDSKHFIDKQLIPAYKKARSIMKIVLKPYGKAQTFINPDGSYRFDCQHGPVECQANMYHACVIEAIDDDLKRLEMIGCMIKDNRLPKEVFYKCAKQHQITNVDLIQKCYDGTEGGELLKLNGDATHALRPAITFIPTITLDGSQGRQAAVLKELLGEVCKIAGTETAAKEHCLEYA